MLVTFILMKRDKPMRLHSKVSVPGLNINCYLLSSKFLIFFKVKGRILLDLWCVAFNYEKNNSHEKQMYCKVL